VDVDAIEQRPGDLAEIALNNPGRAAALPRRVAIKPAGAPVQLSTVLLSECIDLLRGGLHDLLSLPSVPVV
jgi:hypothetical protein